MPIVISNEKRETRDEKRPFLVSSATEAWADARRGVVAGGFSFLVLSFLVAQVRAADTTPPVISDVNVGRPWSSGLAIAWLVDEPGESQVEYGLTTAYGNMTSVNYATALTRQAAM